MHDLSTDMKFEDAPLNLQRHLAVVRDLFNKQKEILPFVTADKDGHRKIIPVHELLRNTRGKDVLSALLVELVRDGADEVTLNTEAWFALARPDSDKSIIQDAMNGKIHTREDRKEVVSVTYEVDGAQIGCWAIITRKKRVNREKVTLGEWAFLVKDYQSIRKAIREDKERFTPEEMKALTNARFSDLWLRAFPERAN